MATTSVQRTPGVTGNRKTWTFSAWFKRGNISVDNDIFGYDGDGSNFIYLRLSSGDTLSFRERLAGSNKCDFTSNQLLRDPAAWYHIVVAVDTNQGTAEDRIKFYLNGTQITSWATDEYYAEDYESQMNESGKEIRIGDVTYYFNGCMSHVVFVDGLQLAASYFGETDATSGMWAWKTPVVSSYGTNGFYLTMQDSSNMDEDTSGNALTFTTTGNLNLTKDNPANNFCTWNPLDNYWQGCTFSNGANTFVLPTSASQSTYLTGTQGMIGGKYYMEIEHTSWTNPDGNNYGYIGIATHSTTSTTLQPGTDADSWCLYEYDGGKRNNGTATTYAAAPVAGDIIGMAVDLVNNKLYFSNNGAWADGSGSWDSSTFDAAVGAITISAPSATTGGTYIPCASYNDNVYTSTYKLNAGGGYLGTTTVGTSNQGAGDIGYFKYPVPTGYYALCTKNIKSQGGA